MAGNERPQVGAVERIGFLVKPPIDTKEWKEAATRVRNYSLTPAIQAELIGTLNQPGRLSKFVDAEILTAGPRKDGRDYVSEINSWVNGQGKADTLTDRAKQVGIAIRELRENQELTDEQRASWLGWVLANYPADPGKGGRERLAREYTASLNKIITAERDTLIADETVRAILPPELFPAKLEDYQDTVKISRSYGVEEQVDVSKAIENATRVSHFGQVCADKQIDLTTKLHARINTTEAAAGQQPTLFPDVSRPQPDVTQEKLYKEVMQSLEGYGVEPRLRWQVAGGLGATVKLNTGNLKIEHQVDPNNFVVKRGSLQQEYTAIRESVMRDGEHEEKVSGQKLIVAAEEMRRIALLFHQDSSETTRRRVATASNKALVEQWLREAITASGLMVPPPTNEEMIEALSVSGRQMEGLDVFFKPGIVQQITGSLLQRVAGADITVVQEALGGIRTLFVNGETQVSSSQELGIINLSCAVKQQIEARPNLKPLNNLLDLALGTINGELPTSGDRLEAVLSGLFEGVEPYTQHVAEWTRQIAQIEVVEAVALIIAPKAFRISKQDEIRGAQVRLVEKLIAELQNSVVLVFDRQQETQQSLPLYSASYSKN